LVRKRVCARAPLLTVAVLLAAGATGCSVICSLLCSSGAGPPLAPRFDIRHGHASDATALSRAVGLIADTHAHYLWGEPTFIQTNLADKISASAIRTPQGDLWGPDAERWLLRHALGGKPIIHLGDAADIACIAEYDAFLAMMNDPANRQGPAQPWFAVPGNHDAYFYGNYQDTTGAWDQACKGSGKLTKSELVTRYLGALAAQPDPGAQQLAANVTRSDYRIDAIGTGGMLVSAAWSVSKQAPWRSWVAQSLELTRPGSPRRVVAILIDTAVYDDAPVLVAAGCGMLNAGLNGDITDDQASVVRAWAWAAHASGAAVVVAGHHPYAALTARAKSVLDDIHDLYGGELYVSAHDHSGKWNVDGNKKDKTWLELNIGAMVDAPIEVRVMQLFAMTDGRAAVDAELLRLDRVLDQVAGKEARRCTLHPEWEAKSSDPDYYLTYRDLGAAAVTDTQQNILDVLLAGWQRYLKFVKSAPDAGPWPGGWASDDALAADLAKAAAGKDAAAKIALLQTVQAQAPTRKVGDELGRSTFRFCQGQWGSDRELARRRIPAPDDWTVILPKE